MQEIEIDRAAPPTGTGRGGNRSICFCYRAERNKILEGERRLPVEAELGGDVEGGDVGGGGGHPDGVAVQPHLEVRLRVHRRILRRLSGAAGGRKKQRDEDEGQRQRHGDGILLLGHGRRLPPLGTPASKANGYTGRV